MVFNSVQFLVFLPIVLALYYASPQRFQNVLLLIASWVFYGFWDVRFLFLLIGSTAWDFVIGVLLDKTEDTRRRKALLTCSLTASLGLLGFFKYWNFFAESAALALGRLGLHVSAPTLHVILPVGISFYTFHTMSYVIDVYARVRKPTRDFIAFATFVAFFPQLVAGPIARANSLLPQMLTKRELTRDALEDGARLMLWGFFKKVVVSDNLNQVVTAGFDAKATGAAALLATYAFGLQIYCDFSGYSDIARGSARLFGFELMENFRAPYLATSIADFWKRWHISLSSWFRDYVYIPMGGGRVSRPRRLFNVMVTFLLSGFWHGADARFLVWGGIHGLAYLPYVVFDRRDRARSRVGAIVGWLVTLQAVMFAWIFFRAEGTTAAVRMIKTIARYIAHPVLEGVERFDVRKVALLWAFVLFAEFASRKRPHPLAMETWWSPLRISCTVSVFLLIAVFGNFDNVPFIYFQF
jgi:D-alanyl-lipoteichoic acid acyltransferase DltB (MBOAT superfamily)